MNAWHMKKQLARFHLFVAQHIGLLIAVFLNIKSLFYVSFVT